MPERITIEPPTPEEEVPPSTVNHIAQTQKTPRSLPNWENLGPKTMDDLANEKARELASFGSSYNDEDELAEVPAHERTSPLADVLASHKREEREQRIEGEREREEKAEKLRELIEKSAPITLRSGQMPTTSWEDEDQDQGAA